MRAVFIFMALFAYTGAVSFSDLVKEEWFAYKQQYSMDKVPEQQVGGSEAVVQVDTGAAEAIQRQISTYDYTYNNECLVRRPVISLSATVELISLHIRLARQQQQRQSVEKSAALATASLRATSAVVHPNVQPKYGVYFANSSCKRVVNVECQRMEGSTK